MNEKREIRNHDRDRLLRLYKAEVTAAALSQLRGQNPGVVELLEEVTRTLRAETHRLEIKLGLAEDVDARTIGAMFGSTMGFAPPPRGGGEQDRGHRDTDPAERELSAAELREWVRDLIGELDAGTMHALLDVACELGLPAGRAAARLIASGLRLFPGLASDEGHRLAMDVPVEVPVEDREQTARRTVELSFAGWLDAGDGEPPAPGDDRVPVAWTLGNPGTEIPVRAELHLTERQWEDLTAFVKSGLRPMFEVSVPRLDAGEEG